MCICVVCDMGLFVICGTCGVCAVCVYLYRVCDMTMWCVWHMRYVCNVCACFTAIIHSRWVQLHVRGLVPGRVGFTEALKAAVFLR